MMDNKNPRRVKAYVAKMERRFMKGLGLTRVIDKHAHTAISQSHENQKVSFVFFFH